MILAKLIMASPAEPHSLGLMASVLTEFTSSCDTYIGYQAKTQPQLQVNTYEELKGESFPENGN